MSTYNKIKGETIQSGASADVDSERFYYDTTANEYRLKLETPVSGFSSKSSTKPDYSAGMFGDVDGAFVTRTYYAYGRAAGPNFSRVPVVKTVQLTAEWNGTAWSGNSNTYDHGGLATLCYTGNPMDARSVGGKNHQGWGNSGYAPTNVNSTTDRNDHVEYNGSSWSINPATYTTSGSLGNSKITRAPDTSDTVIGETSSNSYNDWNGSTWSSSNIPSDPISAFRMSGGGADDIISVSASSPTEPNLTFLVEPLSVASATIYNGTSWSSTPAMNHGMSGGSAPYYSHTSNLMGDSASAIAISNTMTASTYPGTSDPNAMKGIDYDNNTTELWNGTTWSSLGKQPAFVPAAAGGSGSIPANERAYNSARIGDMSYNGGGTGSLNGLFWAGGDSPFGHNGAVFSAANGYKYNFEA
jgi:hypothetical protein